MKIRLSLVCLALLLPILAHAQGSAPTSYRAEYYAPGASQPITTDTFPASAVVCNQTTPTSTSSVNPTRMYWTDPNNAGRVCIYTPPTGANLIAGPVGNFEGVLFAINVAGTSGPSNRAPFSIVGTPVAPAGFGFAR